MAMCAEYLTDLHSGVWWLGFDGFIAFCYSSKAMKKDGGPLPASSTVLLASLQIGDRVASLRALTKYHLRLAKAPKVR
jgi:hypothetical protein